MKLSIIIPVYNCEKYIEKCLESVYVNSDEVEYYIINDGSKDNTLGIIKDTVKKVDFKNFHLINNTNHGVSFSRNIGINKSSGDYIMFVDADDYLVNNWYKKIEEYLDGKNDYVVFSDRYKGSTCNKDDLIKACIGEGKEEIRHCRIMLPSSKIIRRKIIEENNILFDESIINGEDMLFNMDVIKYSNNIRIIDFGIYYYRINLMSSTNNYNEKIIESDIQFHKILNTKIKEMNYLEKYQNKIILNGIYIIIIRLFNSNYKRKDQICYSIKKNEFYKQYITIEEIISEDISIHIKLILVLFKFNLFGLIGIISKLKRYFKNKEEIIELV